MTPSSSSQTANVTANVTQEAFSYLPAAPA
jgi:hypothetical protein